MALDQLPGIPFSVEPHAPTAVLEGVLHDDPEAGAHIHDPARLQLPPGPHQRLPGGMAVVLGNWTQEEDLGSRAGWLLPGEAGGKHLRVVDDEGVAFREVVQQVGKPAIHQPVAASVQHQETALVPPIRRVAGDEFLGKRIVEIGRA